MRKISLEPLFITAIYHGKLGLDTDDITQWCYQLRDLSSGRKKSNLGGWQSEDMRADEMFLKASGLITAIQQTAKTYAQNVLRLQIRKWGINNIWVNINGRGNGNLLHTHPTIQVAGVYYVKVPKDANSNLVFYNPGFEIMHRDIPEHLVSEWMPSNATAHDHIPEQDQIVLFPGWLQHLVMPNQSDDDRISISFNVCFN